MKQFTQEGMFNELSKVTRAINNKNMSKYDLPVYRTGGEDPVKPVDTDKDYLIRMANSPLFVERYARMVGKPIDQVGEEAEAYRQQILSNIETVKVNDVGVYPNKYTKRKQSESIKGAYYPPVEIKNEEIEEVQKNINEAPKFIRKYLQNNFDKTLAKVRSHDHNLFMYDDNPWTRTHELSHASVKGHINDKNVNTYPFKDFSDFPELGKYYEGRKEYLTSPDEQKARVDVGRKYLQKKGLYDPVNEPFTKKHYDLLQWENVKSAFDKNKEMPYDIDEIMSPYDEETTIKMFNDFVSNDSNQSYEKAQYGGLTKFPDGGPSEKNNQKEIDDDTISKRRKGFTCPEGYIYDLESNSCIPTGNYEYVDSADDQRFKDYLIQNNLYKYSQLPNHYQKEDLNLKDILDGNLAESWNETLSYLEQDKKKDGKDFSGDYLLENNDLHGYRGSATKKSYIPSKDLNKFRSRLDFTTTPDIDYTWRTADGDAILKKFPPSSYEAHETYGSFPYGRTFAIDTLKKRYTNPNTQFIEDSIDRKKLKLIYPELTDEEIDKELESSRKDPLYITNYTDDNNSYIYDSRQASELQSVNGLYPSKLRITPQIINAASKVEGYNSQKDYVYLPKQGADSYLQESITDDVNYYANYLPMWDKPSKTYLLKNKTPEPTDPDAVPNLKLLPYINFELPEQTILPGKPYVKPYKPRYGVLAGDEDLDLSSDATQEQIAAKRRQKDAEDWLRKTQEYQNKQRNFAEGGEQRNGQYTHSGKNYKKIDGKWYIEPVENSGKYKLIEKGNVKSRISELEKNAQGYRETKSEKTPNYFDKDFTPVFKDYGPQSAQSFDFGFNQQGIPGKDSNSENVFEIVDPTGLSSWDDVYRSAQETGWRSGETALEMFGAIPMLGKAKLLGNAIDAEKAFARTARQKNNVKAVGNTLKAVGKFGPAVGRSTDAIQAYREFAEGGENPGKGLRGNPWLYTYMQEGNNHEPGQVIGLGANFQHKSGLHGEANVELPFFNKNATGTATSTLGFEKGYKNFYGNASLLNSINPEENPGSFFNPKLGTTLGYQKDLGDHYSFGIEGTNMMKPGQLLDPGVRATFKYRFEGGGGTEYTYSGRPDSRYKKIKNQWYINNSTTGGNFVPIEDPHGTRTTILNNEAVVRNSSYANRPKSYMSSRLPDMLPSETTQMFKPITQNAVMDFTNNMNKGFAKQQANISRASQAIKENVKSIEQNKSYNKKQKDELIKDEYSRLLDYDKRTDLENAGAWLNNHDATHFVQAGGSEPKTAGDYAERTWDIITNPFDAAKYSISGGGLENMPWQYNTLKDLGYDPSAQSYQERFSGSEGKSNMVGDALNSFNLFDAGDKVYRNAEKGNWSDAGLEALRFLEVGAFMKPGMIGKLAKTNPVDYLTKLSNSKNMDKLEGYLRQKSIDIINPFDNLAQSLKGKTNAIDLERKLKSLKVHPYYEDLSKGEKAFDKVKNESLEFWKTPEGRRRVQLYLDENNLTEQGITPELYADMMSDVNFSSPDKVKNIREVKKAINDEREILRKQKYQISQEIQRLEKQLTSDTTITKQGAESNVSKIDELTKRLDNLNDIDEGHLQSLVGLPNYPGNNAHYSPRDSEVFIGEDYVKPSNIDQTVGHEWGHSKHLHPHMKLEEFFPGYFDALGVDIINPIGKSRPLNMRLRDNLDFENMDIDVAYSDLPEHLQSINFKKLYKNAQPVSGTGVDRFTDPETYWKDSAGYFRHNDEANAYLQELVPELINRGMIEKYGDHIDPQMIDELFKQYRTEAANKIIEPVRLLDIVKPTAKSIQNITNELNDLHIIAPVGIGLGAAAAYESLNQESPLPKNLKFGGNISNLQKFIK